MNILVPEASYVPPRHRITSAMIDDLLYDPVKAAWIFFGIELDAFQAAALRIQWFSYETQDHRSVQVSRTRARSLRRVSRSHCLSDSLTWAEAGRSTGRRAQPKL